MATTPAAARRRRGGEDAEPALDRRATIVVAAATVLGREGFQSTSIKDIAAEARVAPGLVHYYFTSKEELLVAVLERLCEDISRRWRSAIEGLTDPIEKIDVAFDASAEWVRDHPDFYRIVFDLYAVAFTNEAVRRGLQELWTRQIREIEQEVEAIYRDLGVRPVLPSRPFAQLIAAAVDGIALHWLAHGTDLEEAHHTLKVLLASTLAATSHGAGRELALDQLLARAAGAPRGDRDATS
jgi:AcrR family transcriptional regulator